MRRSDLDTLANIRRIALLKGGEGDIPHSDDSSAVRLGKYSIS